MNNQIIIFTLAMLFYSPSMVEPRYVYNSQKVSTDYNFMSLIRFTNLRKYLTELPKFARFLKINVFNLSFIDFFN